MKIAITDVTIDPTLQLRDGLDMDRVHAMQEFEEQGGTLPPITVVGEDNLLADGHHRYEAADSSGRREIDVEQVPGGRPEAIAIAMSRNGSDLTQPLRPAERDKGIKLLLELGWSKAKIAKQTGVAESTVHNAATVLKMRGSNIGTSRTTNPKTLATLPAQVHEQLNDTTLIRIASLDTVEEQAEMATAVAAVGLAEPRVREAVKAVKEKGMTVAEAVEEYTPSGRQMPVPLGDVARRVYQNLDRFLASTMTIEGVERDFWQVLDVLVAEQDRLLDPTVNTLVEKLAEVSSRTDHYATALRSTKALKEVSA